ncbi:MAG: pitrilysin family protein [Bacteroidales bacterium]
MKEVNRHTEPKFKNISKLSFTKAKKKTLANNIPLYTINAGEQEILKIDFVFDAGDWFQTKPLLSSSTIQLLQEGSNKFTGEEIAEKIDFLGSYIYFGTGKHTTNITVFTLSKHVDTTLEIIEDIIKHPTFPQENFETYISKKKQQYAIEKQKVEVIAQKKYAEILFGANHPYGISHEPEDFDTVNIEDIKQYHAQYYTAENCKIIATGNISSKHIDSISRRFGTITSKQNLTKTPEYIIEPSTHKKHFFEKTEAVQSAIRIGKLLVNKYNPDFAALQILNTVLGGYFGSRLMSNIREDKGYTYGIGSGIVSHKTAGYFVIVTQVGKEVCDKAKQEIYYELKKLRTETIPEAELQTVKNYMKSSIARNFDGVFALSESLKNILEYDLTYKYYTELWKTINTITAAELKNLANTYLHEDSMYEIIAGSN